MSDRIDELMRSLHEKPRVADQSLIENKLQALRTPATPKAIKPRDGKDGIDGVDGAAGAHGTSGIDGKAGADGANGRNGIDGVAGAPGAMGEQGEQGDAGMVWRGTYRDDIEYWIGDVVGVSGSAYVCVAATNQAPPVGFGWELLVSRGAQGIRGIKGEDGTGGGGAAAAGTLTGATLAENVVDSSLTSVGTLTTLRVSDTIVGSIDGNAETANTALTANTATTAGTVTTAAQPTITSVGTLTEVNTSGVITGTNTTASTSSATGALIIAGGAGIAKDSFINSVKAGIGFTGADATNVTNTSFGNAASDGATGIQNTAIGNQSLRANTANNVTGIGYFSADGNSGSGLCAFGGYAGYSNSGSNVTAFGYSAAYDCAGNFNVAVGDSVLSGPCTGANNTGVGYRSAKLITSGADNTCIGYVAGDLITTGTNNCVIGASADVAALGNTNSIVIGASAVGLGSNTTVIGVAATTETKLFGQLTLDATACISASSATALALKTVVPAGTGVTPTIQVICPSAAYTLTNGTATQAVFNTGMRTITLQAATTYMFEGQYLISTGTNTTHITSMSFVLTTATMTNCTWSTVSGSPAALNAGTTGAFTAIFNSVAGGAINTTSAAANKVITFRGIMRVNAAGTLVPNIQFSAAPGVTCSTLVGSYLKFYPIGANTIDSVGTAIS